MDILIFNVYKTVRSTAGLGWTGVKNISFPEEYLNFFDPLQIFKAVQILKSGLLLKSSRCCLCDFVVVPKVLYSLNIKMSIYKVKKNDKISSCFAFYVFSIIIL